MTEHTLLYVIAIAGVINAAAWIVVVVFGLRMYRELTHLRDSVTSEVKAMTSEVLPLIRETRRTVMEVRRMTKSGRRIAEEVAAVALRRLSPQWFPSRGALKVGVGAAREGLGLLRGWLRRKKQAETDSTDVGFPVQDSPPS